ncbi:MAG: phosphatidate cytidylyltransferase [Phycisphaerales bacterium]|nr:phosphatidate cytidylyltransferase [Phycisphaerales bacterium]
MLRQRLISGISLAFTVIGIVLLDAWLSEQSSWMRESRSLHWSLNGLAVTLLLLALTILAVRELTVFARARGFAPLRPIMYVFAGGLVIGPYWVHNFFLPDTARGLSWNMTWLTLGVAASFLDQAIRRGTLNVLANLSTTLFIIFYAGALVGFMANLRMEVGGAAGGILLLFSMFLVKITDTGAYFVGSAVGRHKFIPWLSPKKSWEGVIGGVLTATLLAIFLGKSLGSMTVLAEYAGVLSNAWAMAAFGLAMGVFSVAGDLCESLLKRDVAIKDSGTLFPGMGGILDVIDSPLLAAPAAWFFWTRIAPIL